MIYVLGTDVSQLAWAAGFVDGDGCFLVTKSKDTRRETVYEYTRVRLQVGQSGNNGIPDTLEKLRSIFGGYISGPRIRVGGSHAKKPVYQYTLHGYERVQNAIAQMWSWMHIYRKQQATKVLRAYQQRGRTRI